VHFSLIIPCYNNADELCRELPPLLEHLQGAGHDVETIVVNDGSSQLNELDAFCAQRHIRLLHHERNLGKGAAVRSGMSAASREIRIFTDADIPFQYATLEMMVSKFQSENADVVLGDRRRSDYFANTPALRQMGTRVFSAIVNFIMLERMGDTQCGIKGFRSSAVDAVIGQSGVNGFAADIEWIHRARKQGLKISSVSAEFRNAGKSSVVLWKHALPMLLDVLKMRFSKTF
jgi:glycosyltransferase involved in cell wall biosynthesis